MTYGTRWCNVQLADEQDFNSGEVAIPLVTSQRVNYQKLVRQLTLSEKWAKMKRGRPSRLILSLTYKILCF